MRLPFLLAAALLASAVPAPALPGAPTLGVTVEAEWAYGTARSRPQKLELMVLPEVEASLPLDLDLTAIGRFRFDAYDRLAPGGLDQPEVSPASRRQGIGDRGELELRELYVERDLGPAWVRVGKQQIVWGKADGLKVLDVVNPQDFREFVLDDFDDSRIPLWSLDVEIPVAVLPHTLFGAGLEDPLLQIVWIPDLTYHDLPEPGAEFAFTAERFVPRPPPGVPVTIDEVDRPDDPLADSDAGLRLTTFLGGFDLSLDYLYHYHDVPIPFRTIGPEGVRVSPAYRRTHLVGGTFANAFGDLTLRGEAGFSFGRFFPIRDPTDTDGALRRDVLESVVGLDWWGLTDTLLSLQVFETWIPHRAAGVLADRTQTSLTFLARRNFRHDTVTVETLWLHGVDDTDGLVRPKVAWEARDALELWLGADVFYGTRGGLFGQFDRADRIIAGFEAGWGS